MKTKISNILGVGLALLMVFSLAFALLPTKVEAAPSLWSPEVGPGAAGTNTVAAVDVNGMAVGPDGATVYVIDNQTGGSQILKSINGGRTFGALANPAGITAPFLCVAVAPDNPGVVAVVDSTAAVPATSALGRVFASRDGGVNWIALPVTPDAGALANRVTDLAVGPARAAAAVLDGRDIVVTTASDAAAGTTNADIFILGQTLAWTAVGTAAAGAGAFDYTSVAFSTGYIGDRVLAAVGSAAAGTSLLLINLGAQWGAATAAYVNPPAAAVLIQATPIDYDSALAAASSIISSDIALPTTGFDPTLPGGQRVWVGMAAVGAVANTDVFRVDFVTVRKLGVATDVDINSISYSGDFNSGTLIAGARAVTAVNFVQTWFTNDPCVAFPTWIGSAKAPTGTANAFVSCAPDFPASKRIFAGTSDGATAGNESAFSVSYNGGVSFNQTSLIDTAINGMADVGVTPDGKTLFLSTWNAATGLSLESLWTTPVPMNGGSWDRIRTSPISWGVLGGAIIRLNPGYATAPVIFWGDVGAVGIQYSSDGGNVFVARNTLPVAITDLAVESATVIYAASGTNVYRSDTSAWNFNVGPVDAGIGPIYMLACAPTYPLLPVAGHLLVGGAGAVVNFSTNSANPGSFGPPAGTGLGAAVNVQVVADTNYATNNIIYAGDGAVVAAGGNFIYRWVVGTSTIWEPISAAALANRSVYGMVATNGILYAGWSTGAALPSGADRTLDPTDAAGVITWNTMNVGAAAGATFIAVPQTLKIDATPMPTLYAIDTTGVLVMSYLDNMATAKTTINAPAGGATIQIDPVNGRAFPVTLNWAPMGFGPGLANTYQVLLYEASQGPAGGEIYAVALAGPGINNPTVDIVPVPDATLADIGYNFVAGTSYGMMIRAANEVSGDVIFSNFCAPVSIDIEAASGIISPPHAGPILTSPTPGAQDVDPGCAFSWSAMAGVTEYELIIATDAALTQPVAGTPVTLNTTAFGPVTLEYGTDYYYAVRATAPTSSVQSIGAFRTIISPEEVAPPVVVEQPTISPAWIWAVVIIGALLVVAVLVLIVRTRRV